MEIINKLQTLPDKKKKIIFWIIMVFVAIFLLFFYIQNIQKKMGSIEGKDIEEELKIPDLKEQLSDFLKPKNEKE